ncbi:hypothetical protein Q7P37_004127 [Cladosporium fusiforme]
MAAQNSAGIQTLLDSTADALLGSTTSQEYGADNRQQAEREAQKIVQKAREYRTKRVKDAKSEAQKEIEDYRQQKETEFKSFESQQTSGNKKAEEDAEKATEKELQEIKQIGDKTGPKVVDDLLKAVVTVNPVVPTRTEQPTV